jgi:hypothetical protein
MGHKRPHAVQRNRGLLVTSRRRHALWAISRIFIAEAAGAPNRLAALFKARKAAMTVMAAGADGAPRIFPVAMAMMPDDRRAFSYAFIDVEILPAGAVTAFYVTHNRIARIRGRRAGSREEDEQNKQMRP